MALTPVLCSSHFFLAMSPSSAVHGGQHDTKYVTFELLLHAAFVADEIWGFMLEPAREKNNLRPVTMETRCFHKKFELQRYPPTDFCTARYEHKSSKKKFQNFQKPRKKQFLGRSWAKIGLRKTQPNVCSKRRDSESWTDIDRQKQRLRHEI